MNSSCRGIRQEGSPSGPALRLRWLRRRPHHGQISLSSPGCYQRREQSTSELDYIHTVCQPSPWLAPGEVSALASRRSNHANGLTYGKRASIEPTICSTVLRCTRLGWAIWVKRDDRHIVQLRIGLQGFSVLTYVAGFWVAVCSVAIDRPRGLTAMSVESNTTEPHSQPCRATGVTNAKHSRHQINRLTCT